MKAINRLLLSERRQIALWAKISKCGKNVRNYIRAKISQSVRYWWPSSQTDWKIEQLWKEKLLSWNSLTIFFQSRSIFSICLAGGPSVPNTLWNFCPYVLFHTFTNPHGSCWFSQTAPFLEGNFSTVNRSIICRDAIIADYNQKRCRKRFWQKCGHFTLSHRWRPIFLTVLPLTLPSPPLPINYQYHYQCHCFHFDHNHIMIVLLDSAWSSPLNQGGRFRPQLCCRLLAATREACGTSYPGAAYYFLFHLCFFFMTTFWEISKYPYRLLNSYFVMPSAYLFLS